VPTLVLPGKHASDWLDRLGNDLGARVVTSSDRTITLDLTDKQLADLIADAEFYAECMRPADTGDIDYRPAAKRLLAAINKQTAQ
jgi:hypothetical protein